MIYANSHEHDKLITPEPEERVKEGQKTGIATATGIAATQQGMSPLNEAEDDGFFSELLRPHRQEPFEYDLISCDGLLPKRISSRWMSPQTTSVLARFSSGFVVSVKKYCSCNNYSW